MSGFEVRSEEDALPAGRLLLIFGGIIVIAVVWVVVAWFLLDHSENAHRPGRGFPERELAARDVVSGIEQTLIETRDHGVELAREKQRQLEGYQWVDREQRIVRIPIEKAMEIVVGGAAR